MAIRNLILSGGVAHDYARTSPLLAQILAEVGISSEVTNDFAVLEDERLCGIDLLTLNCVRWTCAQTPEWRDEWAFHLPERAREGILRFLREGKGLLALHAATICFDDWPEYRRILGAWWEWGVSGHAPLQEHRIRVRARAHPITEGVSDFSIVDELYTDAQPAGPIEALATGEWQGRQHPVLWARTYGPARVCYNALGHGPEAFEHPANRKLLQRGALWAAGK